MAGILITLKINHSLSSSSSSSTWKFIWLPFNYAGEEINELGGFSSKLGSITLVFSEKAPRRLEPLYIIQFFTEVSAALLWAVNWPQMYALVRAKEHPLAFFPSFLSYSSGALWERAKKMATALKWKNPLMQFLPYLKHLHICLQSAAFERIFQAWDRGGQKSPFRGRARDEL